MIRLFISYISMAFVVGCGISFAVPVEYRVIAIGLIISAIALFLFYRNAKIVLIFAVLISFLFGVLRVTESTPIQEKPFENIYEKSIVLHGVVDGDIEHRNITSRYIVRVKSIDDVPTSFELGVLVYEPFPSECVSGESVTFVSQIKEPEDFFTNTGRVFKYNQYLQQFNIQGIAFLNDGLCVGHNHIKNYFADIRKTFVSVIHKILPEMEAALLGGLLLGVKNAFSPELLEAFRITGLIHIVVLSGYNITIVAEAFRRLLVRLPRTISTILSILAIGLFVLLSGAQVAGVRAGVMGMIALIARATYREDDGVRALFLVAAGMALYNPALVIFSTSFHMSFLATFGLLTFTPLFEKLFKKISDKFQLRSIVAVTFSTQIFLLPYLAFAIGEVSIVSVLTNILVLPIVPFAMAAGAIVGGVGLLSITLGKVLSPLAYIPLAYITGVVELFSRIPNATLALPILSLVIIIPIYVFLGLLGIKILKKRRVE